MQENVVGSKSTVREGAYLAEGAIISDNCQIGKGSTVKANVKVWPYKIVEDGAILASSLIWGRKVGQEYIWSLWRDRACKY